MRKNEMPKLENGMFVFNKFGEIGVVVDDKIFYKNGSVDFVSLVSFNEGGYIRFIVKSESGFDLTNFYMLYDNEGIPVFYQKKDDVVWQYEEDIPEVTMEDVYNAFGYRVRIV